MLEFNVNDWVMVKLNSVGLAELEKQHKEFASMFLKAGEFKPPKEDAEGYSKWQLHDLMHRFGHMMTLGSIPPFDTTVRINK